MKVTRSAPAILAAMGLCLFGQVPPASGQATETVIQWSTYLGGPSSESVGAMAGDPSGAVTLGGYSFGDGFPTGETADQHQRAGFADAVVASFAPGGSKVAYSSYIGGNSQDAVHGAASDESGAVYLVGEAHSSDFPTTSGVFQPASGGSQDAFVAKLASDGSGVEWASYLGGDSPDIALGAAVGSDGSLYVTGRTTSDDFPTTDDAIRRELVGRSDIFVARISPDGARLEYSTLFGGSNTNARPSSSEAGRGVDIDQAGAIYITGITDSSDFPIGSAPPVGTRPLGVRNGGGMGDAFVTKLVPGAPALEWSGYLGGIGNDIGSSISVDDLGVVHVGGSTDSPDFPVFLAGQAMSGGLGSYEGWVARIEPGGAGLGWSTFIGGAGNDSVNELALNSDGSLWLSGRTSSGNFPLTADALQPVYGGGAADGFLARLSQDGAMPLYSTFIGGAGEEGITGMVRMSDDTVVVSGGTDSIDYPTTLGAPQLSNAGGVDFFVSSIGPPIPAVPLKTVTELFFMEGSATSGYYTDQAEVAVRLLDADGAPVANKEVSLSLRDREEVLAPSATTSVDGIASITMLLDDAPGTYELMATFTEDDSYQGSSTAVSFVIEREITVTNLVVEGQGSKRELIASLGEDDGPAVAGAEIVFYADGTEIGRASTDDSGAATLMAPPGYRGGPADFEASFVGSDLYAGSSSSQVQGRPYVN